MDADSLPPAEFAFPGPLRDSLVAAILDGSKTSTSSTLAGYAVDGEPLPQVGERAAVVDSDGRRVAVIETTEVRHRRLGDVDLAFAIDEGEGYTSVAEWRAGHERFWHSDEVRAEMGDPDYTVDDDTELVLERFVVVRRL
ncbi:MAG: ASCH domain-containing protein [Nocardioidaceae bacterium]|nr:ASCH domain-containing protein [Nocardioidaceae bacterium]